MRFKNFEIRKCTFLGDPPTPDYHKWNFDLVKWDKWNDNGVEKDYCFSIGHFEWNRREPCFEFRSCGTRYLHHREDGLGVDAQRLKPRLEVVDRVHRLRRVVAELYKIDSCLCK